MIARSGARKREESYSHLFKGRANWGEFIFHKQCLSNAYMIRLGQPSIPALERRIEPVGYGSGIPSPKNIMPLREAYINRKITNGFFISAIKIINYVFHFQPISANPYSTIRIAIILFLCCDRSDMHTAYIPVGMCVTFM